MSWREIIGFTLLGLFISLSVSAFQHTPGYMDAEYYYSGGLRLAGGYGFSEMVLWNYLDDPEGLPHPSHGYWMPLVSILSAAGMAVLNRLDFSAGRLFPLLLAAAVPALTVGLSWKLNRRRSAALLSGCLALLPGFYLPFMNTTDGFGTWMIVGGLFFLLVDSVDRSGDRTLQKSALNSGILGLLAGVMHLSRADGILWLFVAITAAVVTPGMVGRTRPRWKRGLLVVTACLIGYLFVMGPWFARNAAAFGTLLVPGGSRGLWIREYDDLFAYPASRLTLKYWLGSGWQAILTARVWATGQNLQNALAVQGEIFLLPLILLGLWRLRQAAAVRLAVFGWCLTFLAMTALFPFQGARGGFLHSGAAFQPLFWAVAPAGLEQILEWGSGWRGWKISQARNIFGVGLAVLALLLTGTIAYGRLFDSGFTTLAWDASQARYIQLEAELQSAGLSSEETVLVNNAPGFNLATGRPSISIPFASLQEICAAARRYNGQALLLEMDQIPGETALFNEPHDKACLDFLETVDEVRIFRIGEP